MMQLLLHCAHLPLMISCWSYDDGGDGDDDVSCDFADAHHSMLV
jgi:hypothetical protein